MQYFFTFYCAALTRFDLHSTTVAKMADHALSTPTQLYAGAEHWPRIRENEASWQAWLARCATVPPAYCVDVFTDGFILVQPGLNTTFYYALVPFWNKPWRIGLFAPSIGRLKLPKHRTN